MKTIALRFGDSFAPDGGTIAAHRELINQRGYVWYGKIGSPISVKAEKMILANKCPRILLIHSGTPYRYWAYVDKISRVKPSQTEFPAYYCDKADGINTWFRVIRFEKAASDIMTNAIVISSGAKLADTSKHSMSPYYMIDCPEDDL